MNKDNRLERKGKMLDKEQRCLRKDGRLKKDRKTLGEARWKGGRGKGIINCCGGLEHVRRDTTSSRNL